MNLQCGEFLPLQVMEVVPGKHQDALYIEKVQICIPFHKKLKFIVDILMRNLTALFDRTRVNEDHRAAPAHKQET